MRGHEQAGDSVRTVTLAAPVPGPARRELAALAAVFLRLGLTAFGGPAAHIALMRDEFVGRRAWLTEAEFLDLVGAANLVPGPTSTEVAIHIGHRRAGWPGLLVAGLAFILPATLLVWLLAATYVRIGELPLVLAVLAGIKPVMVAIVVQAIVALGKTALASRGRVLIGVAAVVAGAFGLGELLVIAAAGLVALLGACLRRPGAGVTAAVVAAGWFGRPALSAALPALPAVAAAATVAAATPLALFAVFAKIGAVLFGSGYVLLAFLRAELVEARGWLTEAQLLDAVAVGQVTPGPVFTTATFIGHVIGGSAGAWAATAGIFLPAFVFVALSGPLLPRVRRSRLAGAFLDGVNVGALALMAIVAFQLGRAALVGPLTIGVFVGSLALLLWRRPNPGWLVLGGALIGAAAALG